MCGLATGHGPASRDARGSSGGTRTTVAALGEHGASTPRAGIEVGAQQVAEDGRGRDEGQEEVVDGPEVQDARHVCANHRRQRDEEGLEACSMSCVDVSSL